MLLLPIIISTILFALIPFNGAWINELLLSKKKSPFNLKFLADSFILGMFFLIFVPFLFSLLNLNLVKPFFTLFIFLGICNLIRYLFNLYKDTTFNFSDVVTFKRLFRNLNIWILMVVLVSMLCFLFSTSLFYPKMNWDGFCFYLRDAGFILNYGPSLINAAHDFYISDFHTFYTSFPTSVFFSYFMFIISVPMDDVLTSLINYNIIFGYINFLIFLLVLVFLYLISQKLFKNRIFSLISILLFMYTPLLNLYFIFYTLNSDLLFLLFILSLIYNLIDIEHDPKKHIFMIVLTFFLLTLTKINGLPVAVIILFIFFVQNIKFNSKWRMVFSVLFLFILLTTMGVLHKFKEDYLLDPINFSVVLISTSIFLYSFFVFSNFEKTDKISIPQLLNRTTIKNNWYVFVLCLFILILTLAVPVIYTLTSGSPFLYYSPNLHGLEKLVYERLRNAQEGFGDWNRTKEYYYGIFAKGFQFGIFFLLIMTYLPQLLFSKNQNLMFFFSLLFLFFLIWIFIFGATSERHIFFIIPFIAVLLTYLLWFQFKKTPTKAVLITFLYICLSIPVLLPVFFRFTDITLFKGYWNWPLQENIITYVTYSGIATTVCIVGIYCFKRFSSDRFDLFFTLLLGGFLFLFNIYLINSFYSTFNLNQTDYSPPIVHYNYNEALDYVNAHVPEDSTIVYISGYGVEFFTNYKYKYINMLDFRCMAYLNSSINSSKRIYLIKPTQKNKRKFIIYSNIIEATNTTNIFSNQTKLFSTSNDYWEVCQINP